MNRFRRDLAYSQSDRVAAAFDRFYRRAFGEGISITPIADLRLQRQGVDKLLSLPNGRRIRIDEKLRRTDYGDLLIEEFSDFDRRTPGWLSPRTASDFIAYGVVIGALPDTPSDAPVDTQTDTPTGGLSDTPWNGPSEVVFEDRDPRPALEIRLFRTPLLRRKAARRWEAWLSRYGRKFAKNAHYRTSVLPVPLHEVADCLAARGRFSL
ncbi:MAG: hypothetical protein KY468_06455 [Armatimonadetes bacterium]|nr:hypothetical protein [Armatimonadota bacterium]